MNYIAKLQFPKLIGLQVGLFMETINMETSPRFPEVDFTLCERSFKIQKLTGKEMLGRWNKVLSESA